MSLIRLFDDFSRPTSLFDQNFGVGLLGDDLLLQPVVTRAGYCRPWRHFTRQQSGIASLTDTKDGFKVTLDVQQFKPEEIEVKMTGDRSLVVEGKHEERKDEHGFVSRHFVRRYVLPEDVEVEKVQCQLSSDGVLTLHVPKKVKEGDKKERLIPIIQTGVPAAKPAETSLPITHDKEEETKK